MAIGIAIILFFYGDLIFKTDNKAANKKSNRRSKQTPEQKIKQMPDNLFLQKCDENDIFRLNFIERYNLLTNPSGSKQVVGTKTDHDFTYNDLDALFELNIKTAEHLCPDEVICNLIRAKRVMELFKSNTFHCGQPKETTALQIELYFKANLEEMQTQFKRRLVAIEAIKGELLSKIPEFFDVSKIDFNPVAQPIFGHEPGQDYGSNFYDNNNMTKSDAPISTNADIIPMLNFPPKDIDDHMENVSIINKLVLDVQSPTDSGQSN